VSSNFIGAGICLTIAAIPVFLKAGLLKTYKTKVREVLRSI
jgi:hypothetical protein